MLRVKSVQDLGAGLVFMLIGLAGFCFGRRLVPCVDGSVLARALLYVCSMVGAAMCSAFRCGSHDRWP